MSRSSYVASRLVFVKQRDACELAVCSWRLALQVMYMYTTGASVASFRRSEIAGPMFVHLPRAVALIVAQHDMIPSRYTMYMFEYL